jgi:hypothetical protein
VGDNDGGELPVADVRAADDDALAALEGLLEVLSALDRHGAQQVLAVEVRQPEELEQHLVVMSHHTARDLSPLAARGARQDHGQIGERGVAPGGEGAEVKLGQPARERVSQTKRQARHDGGEPAVNES